VAIVAWRRRKELLTALAGAGAAVAAVGVAFGYPDAVAVGSSSASGRESRSSSVDIAYALAVGRDGKPVVTGVSGKPSEGRRRMALARYTTRGRLDRSFGVGGKALTSFGSRDDAGARAVALQADGKVVLAGSMQPSKGLGGFALARYTDRGRLDPSFGQNGKVVTRFGSRRNVSEATALAIQPNGKPVAVGDCSETSIFAHVRFALARYTSQGRLDPSFGQGGKVLTSFGPRSDAHAAGLLIQRDGKLVVAGEDFSDTRPGHEYFAVALARYNADGSLDPSFGTGGRVVTKIGEFGAGADAAVLQADGKIVVNAAGDAGRVLVRYTVNGKLDRSFGVGGKAVVSKTGSTLSLQRDGKFVVAGSVIGRISREFAVHRYKPNGGLDSSFGRGGKVFTDFGAGAEANAVAVQANGKIVAAGTRYRHAYQRGGNDFAIVRYTSGGRLDGSFGSGGRVTTDFGSVWRTRRLGR
jgi:uncharacterized delta-60 repeat protein